MALIKAGLVYDESRLRKSRIAVSWVSGNTWVAGSIYGTVQFAFPWKTLIKNCNFYWVERITSYTPTAFRILLTTHDYSDSKYLTVYDPESDYGPLRKKNDIWYRHNEYTSEFMIDDDVPLTLCSGLTFIEHNKEKPCRLYKRLGRKCPDLEAFPFETGQRILSSILGASLHSVDKPLKAAASIDVLNASVDIAAKGILKIVRKPNLSFGGPIASKASSRAILLGALALFGNDRNSAASELIQLFRSEDVLRAALERQVNEHFGVTGWRMP